MRAKRAALIPIAIAIAISLAGCGSSSLTTVSGNPPPATPTTGSTPPPTGGTGGSGGTGGGTAGGTGGGGSTAATVVTWLYVGGNGSQEAIHGLALKSDNSLAALPGSPYAGPASSVVATSGFAFAFGSNNRLSSYARNSDGSLRLVSTVPTTPFPNTSGPWVLSLDHTGQSLYPLIANYYGVDTEAYTEYSIGSDGSLHSLGVTTGSTDYQTRLQFSPDNRFAYTVGCFHANWDVVGFTRNSDGTLTRIQTRETTPVPNAQGVCPNAPAMSAKNFLVISVADLNTSRQFLASYAVNGDGTLTLANSLPIDAANAPTIAEFDRSGTWLAAASKNRIFFYQLSSGGAITAAGAPVTTGGNIMDLHWDNAGHVFAVDSSAMYIFTVQNGAATPLGSPTPVSGANSVAVLPAS
jgi:6-phosphogluconolactonase (cycloisomerase 2 family)